MKVVIAGGSGALGRRIAADSARCGDEIVILTRSPRPGLPYRQVRWDGRTVGDWAGELADAVVINLAGELVDCRPTRRNIERLRQSRVDPTRALVRAAASLDPPPALWLQMSTLAIYGDAGQHVVDESHPPADGPPQMPGVARPWEVAVGGAATERLVVMRSGVVFDPGTPAFQRLVTLTRWGLGGRIGRGVQWVSWIHVEDFLRALRFLRRASDLRGVVHVTSPEPVQNRDMMPAFRTALRRPWAPPTPSALVRVGASVLGTDPALALTGRRCVPRRLVDAGFTFDHPDFAEAVADLVGRETDPGSPSRT